MVKVLICCASGAGTSMMMKLTFEKAAKSLGIQASVAHSPISEGKSAARNYDLVVTTANFVKMFDSAAKAGVKVAAMKSPVNVKEAEQIFKTNGFAE